MLDTASKLGLPLAALSETLPPSGGWEIALSRMGGLVLSNGGDGAPRWRGRVAKSPEASSENARWGYLWRRRNNWLTLITVAVPGDVLRSLTGLEPGRDVSG